MAHLQLYCSCGVGLARFCNINLRLRDVEKAKRTALTANTQLPKDMSSWIGTEHGAVGIDTIEVSKVEEIKNIKLNKSQINLRLLLYSIL